MSVIPVFWRLMQEDRHEFEANLGYFAIVVRMLSCSEERELQQNDRCWLCGESRGEHFRLGWIQGSKQPVLHLRPQSVWPQCLCSQLSDPGGKHLVVWKPSHSPGLIGLEQAWERRPPQATGTEGRPQASQDMVTGQKAWDVCGLVWQASTGTVYGDYTHGRKGSPLQGSLPGPGDPWEGCCVQGSQGPAPG